MKKIVLTFGLISGAISAALMFATMPFVDQIGFDKGMYVGYTAMLISFMLVFFGVRSYRENIGNGSISFGRAIGVGLLITLMSTLCYVVSWLILSYAFLPDFFEKYASYTIEQLRASGASTAQIDQMRQQMDYYNGLYQNPFIRAAFTAIEPLPVGLLVTLISALILRKKSEHGKGNALPNMGAGTATQN